MSEQNTPDWGERIRAARTTKDQSTAVYEQTVRDAHTAGRSATQIARDLDRKDRTVITRILRANPAKPVPAPALPVVVFLRARSATWERVSQAMHMRGWMTVGNGQQAWYLSRAGATCVHVDLITYLDDSPIDVQLMQAVEAQPAPEPDYPVKDLLPVMASLALERAHPEAAEFRVKVQTVAQEWKRLAGGAMYRPTRWDDEATNNLGQPGAFVTDEQQIARYVADLLE